MRKQGLPKFSGAFSILLMAALAASSAWAAQPPVISSIPNQSALPNQAPTIAFTVGDDVTPAADLLLGATSSNTNLIRNEDIFLGGSGSNRTITLNVQAQRHGSATITVTVTDTEGLSTSTQFTFRLEEFTSLGTPGEDGSPEWGDYNNDGLLDYIVNGSAYPLRLNLGQARFTNPIIFMSNRSSTEAKWADYNNDGYLDVFFAGAVNRNIGGTRFTNSAAGISLMHGYDMLWGDFDNDGLPDIVIEEDPNYWYRPGAFYHNSGNDTFTNIQVGLIFPGGAMAAADFDNDGDLDLLVTGFALGIGATTRLYLNSGGTFVTLPLPQSLARFNGMAANWGDYDNDGYVDLLLTGTDLAGNYLTRIYHNDAAAGLTDIGAILPTGSGHNRWLDYDNDGWLDAFVGVSSSGTNTYRIFRNNGNGSFTDIDADLYGATSFADYDNDGDLDALYYRNNILRLNTVAEAPTGLSATTVLTRVTLSWNPATDANQVGGHSYNIRIGRSPGACDVVSPMSDLATGKRRVVDRGNAGQCGMWFLTNLSVGTYYWSVQAIDHSYAGSAWAPEATFVIPDQPPRVITDGATNISFTEATLTGRVCPSAFPTLFRFEYGLSTNYSDVTPWQSAGSGNDLIPVSGLIAELAVGRVYHFRIVATNQQGVMAGFDRLFTTRTFMSVSSAMSQFTKAVAAWGDFDNDNDLDLLITGALGTHTATRLYRNDGAGNFTDTGLDLPGVAYGAVAWGDYDNDGWLDFVLSGSTNVSGDSAMAITRLYRNLGNGTFTNILTCLPSLASPAIAWGDYDNDGRLDLLLTGYNNGYRLAAVYRNNPQSLCIFTRSTNNFTGATDGSVAWADFDNDGYLDFAISGNLGSTAYGYAAIYRNNRDGSFSVAGPELPDLWSSSLSWGDFDNDGDLDLLFTGWETGSAYSARTLVYRNDGNGNFTVLSAGLPGMYSGYAGWGDFDNDGFLDMLLAGKFYTNTSPRVLRGWGDGTFLDIGLTFTNGTNSASGWADYDRDGDLDYFVFAGSQLNQNVIAVSNTPPSAPTQLSATVLPGNDVRFAWAAASDLETSDPRGLNYTLRVGTTPGGGEIVSAPADPLTGFRRLAERGKIQGTNWTLRGLPRGIYYWSVQAVDGGLAGSPFAPEATFIITNGPPTISAIPDQGIPYSGYSLPIPFTISDEETLADNLILTPTSSRTSLVQNANIIFGGSGSNRTITLQCESNATGFATITITVRDEGGLTASRSFLFSVASFTPLQTLLIGINDASVAWGDYDNDGLPDVALSGRSNGGDVAKVYHNEGKGVFREIDAGLPLSTAGKVAWGDYDNDGQIDLLFASQYLLHNNGNSTFSLINLDLPHNYPRSAGWGDFNNDGLRDILIGTTLYLNRGYSVFERVDQVWSGLPQPPDAPTFWADVDNDGDLDVLVLDYGGYPNAYLNSIFLNRGDGTFTNSNAVFPAMSFGSAAFGDFDNDGDLDLALTGISTGAPNYEFRTIVYRNNGFGQFTEATQFAGVAHGSIAWGDYDGDGYRDLLVVGSTTPYTSYNIPASRIYRNNREGTFTEIDAGLQGTYHSAAAWADFDADGDLDILLAGQQGEFEGMIGLYRNNWNHVSEPPPVPTGLMAAVTTNQALLSWHRDSYNASCSFNLRVGTTPGGTDVVSPQADLVTGRLMIPQNGAAQKCWKLNYLLPGRYYWSVQSVNRAFRSSSFAPETQFVIPDAWLAGSRLSGENFEFDLHGRSAQTYRIEISTNLINWSYWRTVQPANGISILSTPAQGGPAFYRIRLNE